MTNHRQHTAASPHDWQKLADEFTKLRRMIDQGYAVETVPGPEGLVHRWPAFKELEAKAGGLLGIAATPEAAAQAWREHIRELAASDPAGLVAQGLRDDTPLGWLITANADACELMARDDARGAADEYDEQQTTARGMNMAEMRRLTGFSSNSSIHRHARQAGVPKSSLPSRGKQNHEIPMADAIRILQRIADHGTEKVTKEKAQNSLRNLAGKP